MTVQSISNSINNLMEKARTVFPTFPAVILLCGAIRRPGVSVMTVVSNIIRRQSEIGAPIGPNVDGSANMMEKLYLLIVEEIFKEIFLNGKVQIVMPPGSIKFRGMGSNSGGPMVVEGVNTNAATGIGQCF